uniref:Ovule protein n=1 Tax=Schistosoma curassoni TaxID=6186 RepID=A0A183KZT1_9TREM
MTHNNDIKLTYLVVLSVPHLCQRSHFLFLKYLALTFETFLILTPSQLLQHPINITSKQDKLLL